MQSEATGFQLESGEARRTARGLLARWTEGGVSLRNLDGWRTQCCDLDCRQDRQYGQWSRSRALRIRTGGIRLRVMMPGRRIMSVMPWRVMTEGVTSRCAIVVMPRRVILGPPLCIGIT